MASRNHSLALALSSSFMAICSARDRTNLFLEEPPLDFLCLLPREPLDELADCDDELGQSQGMENPKLSRPILTV